MSDERGVSLLEMMIVVTILGILATISIPRFGKVLTGATEGAAKGQLGAMRSAVSIHYADTEGQYPATLEALTVGSKYMSAIPKLKILPYHQESDAVSNGTATTDSGGWAYDNDSSSGRYGRVWVNCSHTDTKGSVWSVY